MSRLHVMVVLAVLLKGGYTGNAAVKVQAPRDDSFKLPPSSEWLPRGNSTEPIFQIHSALRTMRPLLEPLNRQSDMLAMQELETTVLRKFFKSPGTRTAKDYADIMNAGRKFGRVYRSGRWYHHVAHDVRVVQLLTTWMLFVVDAFENVRWTPMYDVHPFIAKEMNDEFMRMEDYVKQTEKGIASDDNYPVLWVGLDFIFRDLIYVSDPYRSS